MTFPTKADIEFFKEAKRIQEGWEPKFGDWVYPIGINAVCIIRYARADSAWLITQAGVHQKVHPNCLIFLPRQGQLQEMLEERGYKWSELKSEDGRYHYAGNDIDLNFTVGHGPTPSIALGKCLLEVLGD